MDVPREFVATAAAFFFVDCPHHVEQKKNQKVIYSTECTPLCNLGMGDSSHWSAAQKQPPLTSPPAACMEGMRTVPNNSLDPADVFAHWHKSSEGERPMKMLVSASLFKGDMFVVSSSPHAPPQMSNPLVPTQTFSFFFHQTPADRSTQILCGASAFPALTCSR